MLGFNGGLIGKERRVLTATASQPGCWTLQEQIVSKRDNRWPSTGLWTPALAAAGGPSAWIDANLSDYVTISGGNVTSVSGVIGPTFTATGAIKWNNTTLNSLPVLDIDNRSAAQYLSASYNNSSNTITIAIVAKSTRATTSSTLYPRLFSLNASSGFDYNQDGTAAMLYGVSTVTNATFYRNSSSIGQSLQNTDTAWAMHCATRSAASTTMASNGETRVTGSTGSANFAITSVRIGNNTAVADSGLYGSIAEAVIWNSALGQTDEDKLFGYLAWKWGLVTSLPSNHPYKNNAPTV